MQKDTNYIDKDQFHALFDHYYAGLVVYAMEFSIRREEAEDVIQDIFVTLWKKREQLSEDGIKTYLFRAAKNKCLNYLSHLKVRTSYQDIILKEEKPLNALATDRYIESELRNYLDRVLGKLPPQRRKVFIMNHLEDKSPSEIAQELGVSPKTIYSHLDLAYKFLRKNLSRDELLLLFLFFNIPCLF